MNEQRRNPLNAEMMELLQQLLTQAIRAGQFNLQHSAPDGDGGDELTGNATGSAYWTSWIAVRKFDAPEINLLVDGDCLRSLLARHPSQSPNDPPQ